MLPASPRQINGISLLSCLCRGREVLGILLAWTGVPFLAYMRCDVRTKPGAEG
jgi:hypothetical protein